MAIFENRSSNDAGLRGLEPFNCRRKAKVIKEKLKIRAERQGLSRSEIVRNALIEYFEKDAPDQKGSFYDLAKDLAGSVESAPDLSTNKAHLSGYGQ